MHACTHTTHTHAHTHMHAHTHTHTRTEEKVSKKRKVFKEDLKELTSRMTETGSWFQITGAW